jgi:hypothetical protein
MIHHNSTIKKPRSTTTFFSKPLQKHQITSQIKKSSARHTPRPKKANFASRVTFSPRPPLYQVKAVINTVLQKEYES